MNGRPVSSFPAYAQYIYVPITEPPTDPTSAGSNQGSNQTPTSAGGVPPPSGPVFPTTFQHQPPYLYHSTSCQSPALLLPYPVSQFPPPSPVTPSHLINQNSASPESPSPSPRDNKEGIEPNTSMAANSTGEINNSAKSGEQFLILPV